MKPLDALTNYALVQRYERLQPKWDKTVNALCDAGLGSLKPSDMRERAKHGIACSIELKYLALCDESCAIRAEADRRYGPGLITVSQLTWSKS